MSLRWFIFLIPLLLASAPPLFLALKRRRQIRFIRRTLARSSVTAPRCRVMVALSTLPDRIANLQPTLDCLVNQTRVPDEIVLAVPQFSIRQGKEYRLPDYLARYPLVRVLRSEQDWGPATKFIPVIQEELTAGRDDSLIMVVDDDRIYAPDTLATYLHYHGQLPDAALCFRGAPMPRNLHWTKPRLCLAARIRRPRRTAVMMGCGSYFLQPRFFEAGLWDYSTAPRGAFYMDDIWISGWLDRRGVEKYVVPGSAMMRTAREQSGTMTLDEVPNGRRYSNNEVIAYFRETWNVFLPD
jgi:hypothetical protein